MKSMVEKVRVAVFDANLKAQIKKYEISESGSQISIKSGGGKAHFMPSFNNSSYLDIKKPWFLGGGHNRIFFVRKMASACVDFQTPHVPMPDPKQLEEATESGLVKNFGKEDKDIPWYIWILFLLLIGIALRVFGVIV